VVAVSSEPKLSAEDRATLERSRPWLLRDPCDRMPFPAGRQCRARLDEVCVGVLSRWDAGPDCWPCHQEKQRQARLRYQARQETAAA
jgi:hypothetical protein